MADSQARRTIRDKNKAARKVEKEFPSLEEPDSSRGGIGGIAAANKKKKKKKKEATSGLGGAAAANKKKSYDSKKGAY